MLTKLLLDHPREIGETYPEHAAHALWIGARLIVAGFACLVHALIPGLCVRTASRTIAAISELMRTRTANARTANAGRHPVQQVTG